MIRIAQWCRTLSLGVVLLASHAGAQSCRWDGTAPWCAGECGANEQELARFESLPDFWVYPFLNGPAFGNKCYAGTKALCCATPGRSCRWDGTAPFCAGECRSGETQVSPPEGASPGAACLTGSKVYCCSSTGTVSQPLAGNDCTYGPGTCAQGFVWRGAGPDDRVCVTEEVRAQVEKDNREGINRRSPTGGPWGPESCMDGFVWRNAFPGDKVCVEPRYRDQAAQDNQWASVRNACP